MTPREAAKALLLYIVSRGKDQGHSESRIIDDLREQQFGYCGFDYWAEIGSGNVGTKNGKRRITRPGEIIVKDINSIPCNEIFDLGEIVREMCGELTQPVQGSLWEASNAQ